MRLRRVLALLPLLLLPACSGSDTPAKAPTTHATAGTPSTEPALTTSARGTAADCLERVSTADIGFWNDTVTASTPLRITGMAARGHGVRVVGGLLVPVVGGTVNSIGVTDWPPVVDRGLRAEVDWSARTRIVGARVPVQRAMLPLLHIRAVGGGKLDAVELSYLTDAGQRGTVRLTLGIRFSRTTC